MKIDLLLVPMGARYAEMQRAAEVAEAAGFDGLWTWDHLRDPGGSPAGVPECWTTLTALAQAVARVSIGPLVLNVISHHPAQLANAAATLQEISGGRLLLGMGAGGSLQTPYAREQLAIGRPVESDPVRRQRLEEAIEILRRLWSGDASRLDGRHYQLESPSGYRQPTPPPPIIVGGFGPRMATFAGRCGDGFNTQAFHPRLDELLDLARDAYAKRDTHTPFVVTVFAGLSVDALNPASSVRTRLEHLGVERLILLTEPPYPLRELEEAHRFLARTPTPPR